MPHTDEIVRRAALVIAAVAMPVLAGCAPAGAADAAGAGTPGSSAGAAIRAVGAPRRTPLY